MIDSFIYISMVLMTIWKDDDDDEGYLDAYSALWRKREGHRTLWRHCVISQWWSWHLFASFNAMIYVYTMI